MDNTCECGHKLNYCKTVKTNNEKRKYIYQDILKKKHNHNENDHYIMYKCILNHEYVIHFPNFCWCGWSNL